MQQVTDDRDYQFLHVQDLTSEVSKYKEYSGRSSAELESLTLRSNKLEVRFS